MTTKAGSVSPSGRGGRVKETSGGRSSPSPPKNHNASTGTTNTRSASPSKSMLMAITHTGGGVRPTSPTQLDSSGKTKKNAKGGIYVSDEEIESAFAM